MSETQNTDLPSVAPDDSKAADDTTSPLSSTGQDADPDGVQTSQKIANGDKPETADVSDGQVTNLPVSLGENDSTQPQTATQEKTNDLVHKSEEKSGDLQPNTHKAASANNGKVGGENSEGSAVEKDPPMEIEVPKIEATAANETGKPGTTNPSGTQHSQSLDTANESKEAESSDVLGTTRAPESTNPSEVQKDSSRTDANEKPDSTERAQIPDKLTDKATSIRPNIPPKDNEVTENGKKERSTERKSGEQTPVRKQSRSNSQSTSEPGSAAGSTVGLAIKASRRSSAVSSPRRHASAKVDNSAIFKKTFEIILKSKEAHKNSDLKSATQKAIDSLDNSASRDPHVLFEALKLTCQTSNNELKSKAVDLFGKLFDYASFDDEDDRVTLTDASIDVISSCFEGEGTNPELEMQVVRALIHSIILMPTHGASLLKAVRSIYNVFIFSLSPGNQAVAQGTLNQVIGTIFQRVSDAIIQSKSRASRSSSTLNLKEDPTISHEKESNGKMTLEKLQNITGDSADSDRVNEANRATEKDEDLVVKDAFLVFRAMCKLSVKDLETDSIDMRSHSVRSKLLSLHVIHTILRNNIDIFLSKDVVILSSSSDDQTRLIDAVRSYLCQSLIRNAASPLAPVFELTLETFWLLISNLRSDFKMEIPVLWEQIYFPVAEMKTSTPHQKRYLLSIIERLCNDSRCIIEFYLNYDCDSSQPNICEFIIDYLTRLSLARVDATPAQKLAYRENKKTGISLYDTGMIDNLTTAVMSSKPPEPDVYNNFPLEYALKITSLDCSVAFLRSLYSWAQKGFVSTQKLANSLTRASGSHSPHSTVNNSRNPSFLVNHNSGPENEADDPETFETQKQRKKALLEGTRQFSQKPKKGIAYFIEHGFIKNDSPEEIASFLLKSDHLDKAALGDFLGDGHERNIAIMHAFVDQMDFEHSSFVDSLRQFLQSFRLPGEGQKIDRFMLKFAERYVLGNPGVFSNADTAYVLAYSVVMLNTDQHSKSVKNRMVVDNFIMNNSGIDDGKDLPREFLEQVFYEIQNNEIKLQSEQHAALLAGENSNSAQVGFFGSKDWNREAYNYASKEMSTKTEKLVKNLGKRMKSEDSLNHIYYAASNVQHVKSIFDTIWMSILAGLTGPFKEYDEPDVIKVCLEGIKLSIRISCMFELQYAKKSFIGALVQFQNLNNLEEIRAKSVDAIYIMLDVAVSEGNHLQKSWTDILTSISQLERLQLIAKGIDQHSIPDVTTAKLVNRNSFESTYSQPSGFFSSFSRETSASQSAAIKFHSQQLSVEAAQLLCRTDLSVAIDKVFTNSSELSGEGIKDFVEALSQVSLEEIDSSGQSANPRMFSLQKVVDICYYNMGRIRLEWSQLWATLGEVFNTVGCNPNVAVSFFALDSLRQLSMRFMEIEELAHFKFQKEFLKPFQHIITYNPSPEVKDMVLECINNMVLAKASYIKSGWKTIFEVLTVAAKEKKDNLVTKAYKLAFTINKDYSEEVIKQDSFADLVACFTEFAKNEQFQKVGLLSLEILSKIIVRLAKTSMELNKEHTITSHSNQAGGKTDNLMKLWFPVLFGFYDIIMRGEELEVRSRTLTHFFDVLLKYGHNFEADFWDLLYQKLLAPIFGVLSSPWKLRHDDESMQYGGGMSESDRLSFWVSTTLIQALNSMISLFTHYFEALTPRLNDLLILLRNCICQENDTIARTGKSCFEDFLIQNCNKFDDEEWKLVIQTFNDLFELTTATELFTMDPLREADENSDVESFDMNGDDLRDDPDKTNISEPAEDKSTIVVKCVLQLLMIETVSELAVKEEFYDAISVHSLMDIAGLLYKSYDFARRFNDNYDLRVRLWNAGVIERLPNLLKQESMSAAVFLNLMFRLYCDDSKSLSGEDKDAIIDKVVPLSYTIVQRFCELDDVNQQKSIVTWRPVIAEIFGGFVEMDDKDFKQKSPNLYRLTLNIFDRNMGGDLRRALQMFMARVGDVFVQSQ